MNDIKYYTNEMKKSLMDKLFFIDKVDTKRFVDYGCADGAVIKFLASVYPENTYIGYDKNKEMIETAQKDNEQTNVSFTSDLNELRTFASEERFGDCTMVLSSVFHEIYDRHQDKDVWTVIRMFSPTYLAIRDMCVSRMVNRESDPIAVATIYRKFGASAVERWEHKWGSLFDNRSLVHFLLKYRFEKNWETEFEENYLPFTYEQFLCDIPKTYDVIYNEHYTLHFMKQEIRKDFGIDLQDRTHMKLVLKFNNKTKEVEK